MESRSWRDGRIIAGNALDNTLLGGGGPPSLLQLVLRGAALRVELEAPDLATIAIADSAICENTPDQVGAEIILRG